MQGNDLANVVVPRDLVVWEGLLGVIHDPKVAAREAKFRQRQRWEKAVACYDLNEILARQISYLDWKHNLEIDVLTYHGDGFRDALEERVDRESLPVREVLSYDPDVLARLLPYEPRIRAIYDPFPDHAFRFGAKTRYLSPNDGNLFGAL